MSIDTVVGSVTAIDLDEQQLHFEADLVVWTAGFAPSPLAREAGMRVSETGQVVVDDALRSVWHPSVFAAGDGANAGLDPAGREPAPLNMGFLFLGASLGRENAVVQLLNPDGSMRPQVIRGRPQRPQGGVEHYVTLAVSAERTVPRFYQWSPAPRRSGGWTQGSTTATGSRTHRPG